MGWFSRLLGRPHLYDDRDRGRQLTALEEAARRVAAHHAGVDPEGETAWTEVAEWARTLRDAGHDREDLAQLGRGLPASGLPNPRSEIELTPWQEELSRLLVPAYAAADELRAIGER